MPVYKLWHFWFGIILMGLLLGGLIFLYCKYKKKKDNVTICVHPVPTTINDTQIAMHIHGFNSELPWPPAPGSRRASITSTMRMPVSRSPRASITDVDMQVARSPSRCAAEKTRSLLMPVEPAYEMEPSPLPY